jgi:hypothetical protein
MNTRAYRDPVQVIDQTIDNLEYLSSVFWDDLDAAGLDNNVVAARVMRSIATIRAIHVLLPRLRVARSNHENSLPAPLPDSPQRREYPEG